MKIGVSTLFIATVVLASGLWGAPPAHSQDTVQSSRPEIGLTFGGDFQARASAGVVGDDSRFGFGVRRARIAATLNIGEQLGVYLRTNFATGNLFAVDAYAFYELDAWSFRAGRFVGAQPRAMALTSGTRTDALDRATIAERWAQRTIGSDGRDFGFEAQYENDQTTVSFYVHNGDGNWSRLRGNYREGLSTPPVTGGVSDMGLALSLYGTHGLATVEGVEVGGFIGYNSSRNPATEAVGQGRSYGSLAAHAYWGADPGSQPWRLKADVIGIRYEALPAFDLFERSLAVSLLAAHGPREDIEIFTRYEYDYRVEGPGPDQYFVAGAHWSPSARRGAPFHHERLTLGYGIIPSYGAEDAQHLLVLQAQIAF